MKRGCDRENTHAQTVIEGNQESRSEGFSKSLMTLDAGREGVVREIARFRNNRL